MPGPVDAEIVAPWKPRPDRRRTVEKTGTGDKARSGGLRPATTPPL
ncbi:MAG: hypothetical protein LOD87_06720 [Planifilum fulgidum]|nr:hypothetical protein [Planifilum fulgidum]